MTEIIPAETIVNKIVILRGEKVILDRDLAELYGVETRNLIQAVKRNIDRFPSDFIFQLSSDEFNSLRSHFVISKGKGGRRHLPYAFTEHGSVMAASILNSEQAVAVSIYVVRAFIKLRQMLGPYKEIMKKLEQIEKKLRTHDEQIKTIAMIQELMSCIEDNPKEPIGYLSEAKGRKKKTKTKRKT